MRIKHITFSVVIISWLCLGLFVFFAAAESPVRGEQEDTCGTLIAKSMHKEATAGLFANATNRAGSLRRESAAVIDTLLDTLSAQTGGFCQKPCVPANNARVILSTVPRIVKKDYAEKDYCAKLLARTSDEPLRYKDRTFKSREKLQEWVSEFSQGEGKDGKDLYRRCDKSCSPRYEYVITETKDGRFSVSAEVVCGHARDKSDNMYAVKGSLLQTCTLP